MLRMAVKGPGALCHVACGARIMPLAPVRWGRGARHRNARAAAKHRMHSLRKFLHMAATAQLGERQTEDLKVPGSIPGLGMLHAAQCCAWLSKAPAPCAMLRAVLAACP